MSSSLPGGFDSAALEGLFIYPGQIKVFPQFCPRQINAQPALRISPYKPFIASDRWSR